MPTTEEVTPGEIVRTLRGLQEEIRALRGEHVRRDLYEAHKAQMEAEVGRVRDQCARDTERLTGLIDAERREREADERDRGNMRRQLLVATWGAGLAGALSIILALVR